MISKGRIYDAMMGVVKTIAIIAFLVFCFKTGCYPGAPAKKVEPDTLRIDNLAAQIRIFEETKPVSDSIAEVIFKLADEGVEITRQPYTYSGYPCLFFQDKRARYAYQLGNRKASRYADKLIESSKRYPTFFSKAHLWMPDKGGHVYGYHQEFFGDPMFLRYKELITNRKYKKARIVLDLLSSVTTDVDFNRENPYERISDTLVVQDIDIEDILTYAKYDLSSISENARLRYLLGDEDAYKWMEGAYTTGALYLSPYEGILTSYDGYADHASEFFRQLTPYMIVNYNNIDPAWVYNTALLVKGSSAVMPSSVRKGTFTDEIFQTYKDVQSRLSAGECAIEIVKVPGLKGEDVYKAVVLKSGDDEPVMVELGTASIINDIVSDGRAYSADGMLYKYVWEPIIAYLHDITKVYMSADGVLCLINAGEIKNNDGKTVSEQFEIINCISTKDVGIVRQSSGSNDVVLFGGLTYSREIADENEWFAQFEYLPGTAAEIQAVDSLAKSHGFNTLLFSGDYGTKDALRALSGRSMKVLHIATHGFYYTENRAKDITFFDKMLEDNDPLKRCGLVMSDGSVLGSDIAKLDFSSVDMVVLSACNTGLGDVTAEGVAGLQKAFRQAGVSNIVVSLGAIEDISSRDCLPLSFNSFFNLETFGFTLILL